MFLGKDLTQSPRYSDAIAKKIDTEIGSLLQRAQQTAARILEAHRARLTLLASRLVSKETIEGAELQELLGSSLEEVSLAAD